LTVKKITLPCQFGDKVAPFNVYVGSPTTSPDDMHPLEQQEAWLRRERGGVIPAVVMDSFRTLFEISLKEKVSFEELCVYALRSADQEPLSADAPPGSES
jgi:hypothetical protein